ncbi:carboxylesterase/lipase family protein [Streptomyces monticola]|uniref:Carboxylic ester hydrolase n=1 Tax=Streptomyces monticola TaxID=2666263 RepID=A0ABW2JYR4_9ACTN
MRRRHRIRAAAVALALLVTAGAAGTAQAAGPEPERGPAPPTVVHTDTGLVRGRPTTEGRQFLGIPYAEPPVGRLRWKEPRPAKPWQGVRDATKFGNRCAQTASWDPGYEKPTHTEDCLGLNVYVPDGGRPLERRPVMVWLHGGGLTAGAGEDIVPDTFAKQTGALVVTVNYRLGAMGFLAARGLDAEAGDGVSGNYGMQDQQAALRWVRSNIANFGGDPGRVTVAGESAGGRSVCTQLASPTGRGLFRAGIIQSGAYEDCAARERAKAAEDGAAFAKKAGCPHSATAVACLRGKTPQEILAAQSGIDWGPVAGGAFLPEQPVRAFAKGAAAGIPVLNGANQDEGRLFGFAQYDAQGKPLTTTDYPQALTGTFGPVMGGKVLERYPAGSYPSPTIAYGTAVGDRMFACPALRLDTSLAGRGKVYAYEFADRTSPPFASLRQLPTTFDFGATHVNEVQYLFKHFGLDSPLNAEQRDLSRQMVEYWGSFIRDGVPRAAGQPGVPDGRERVLSLRTASAGGNTASATVHREHLCDLWDAAATA